MPATQEGRYGRCPQAAGHRKTRLIAQLTKLGYEVELIPAEAA
jgi:transposase